MHSSHGKNTKWRWQHTLESGWGPLCGASPTRWLLCSILANVPMGLVNIPTWWTQRCCSSSCGGAHMAHGECTGLGLQNPSQPCNTNTLGCSPKKFAYHRNVGNISHLLYEKPKCPASRQRWAGHCKIDSEVHLGQYPDTALAAARWG